MRLFATNRNKTNKKRSSLIARRHGRFCHSPHATLRHCSTASRGTRVFHRRINDAPTSRRRAVGRRGGRARQVDDREALSLGQQVIAQADGCFFSINSYVFKRDSLKPDVFLACGEVPVNVYLTRLLRHRVGRSTNFGIVAGIGNCRHPSEVYIDYDEFQCFLFVLLRSKSVD